jgi:membrane protein DedA with SNARE-associated domain
MSSHLVLASITTTLTDFVGRHGAYAIFIIMAVDAVLPVGGELTMLYAGALAAGAISSHHPVLFGHTLHTGLESYIVLALAGTLGYLLGSLLERHGRWLHLNAANLGRAERWFDRHGRAAVFLGRITPVVRSFISIPAGVFETPLVPYTLLTLAGSALWCFAFAGAGWALGDNYDKVHHAFTGVEVLVVAGIVFGIGYIVYRRRQAGAPARG